MAISTFNHNNFAHNSGSAVYIVCYNVFMSIQTFKVLSYTIFFIAITPMALVYEFHYNFTSDSSFNMIVTLVSSSTMSSSCPTMVAVNKVEATEKFA